LLIGSESRGVANIDSNEYVFVKEKVAAPKAKLLEKLQDLYKTNMYTNTTVHHVSTVCCSSESMDTEKNVRAAFLGFATPWARKERRADGGTPNEG